MCHLGAMRIIYLSILLIVNDASTSWPIITRGFFTALFNNMRTLKFKAQPTNVFFATVNQMFGGSSQLPTTAERAVIKSNQIVEHSSDNIVGSWEGPPNIGLTVVKNAFVG